ncbi:MAG: glycerophosphodiester phosphodiesterase family protein [Deltaproteobacteria bacterium]
MMLPKTFLTMPIAHRGFHVRVQGRIENSLEAAQAAMNAGYGIECDVQLTADGQAAVFHDYDMKRLTGQSGAIQTRTLSVVQDMTLSGSNNKIPSLSDLLNLVGGKVPLLIEIKDQDGAMGNNVGKLEEATAKALADYEGPVAVMSFNPHSIATMARLAPNVPRGLTTSAYLAKDWGLLPAAVREDLRQIPDYARTDSCFISHEAKDLDRPRVTELKASGAAILCWTIRSAEAEAEARRIADNITFEGYTARTIP